MVVIFLEKSFSNWGEFMTSSPFLGICSSLLFYRIALYINQKTKSNLANPLLLTTLFLCLFLWFFNISVDDYQKGAGHISLLLGPCTVALALSIYQQKEKLKQYFWSIIFACAIGSLASIISVFLLSRLVGLDEISIRSLSVKSVTTPIAVGLSTGLGGNVSITVIAVAITGIFGSLFAPFWLKWLALTDRVAIGLSIGVSSHALGTSKAISMGDIEGAMSSVAIGIAGLFTVLWISLYLLLFGV